MITRSEPQRLVYTMLRCLCGAGELRLPLSCTTSQMQSPSRKPSTGCRSSRRTPAATLVRSCTVLILSTVLLSALECLHANVVLSKMGIVLQ